MGARQAALDYDLGGVSGSPRMWVIVDFEILRGFGFLVRFEDLE